MKSIEDAVIDKIYSVANYALSKIIEPDITLENITDLDEVAIEELKQKYGIEGIILDIDGILRKNMQKIPDCSEQCIENLKKQLKIIVLSNDKNQKARKFIQSQNLDYMAVARKPLKASFKWAYKKLGTEPERLLMIGEYIFKDIDRKKSTGKNLNPVQGMNMANVR